MRPGSKDRSMRHIHFVGGAILATCNFACAPTDEDTQRNDLPEVASVDTPVVGGCCNLGSSEPTVNGLRLTLQSGAAIPANDISSSPTVTVAPFASAAIALFDGSAWISRIVDPMPSAAPSPSAASTNYAVYAYWDGADVKLEVLPWPLGVDLQDGVPVKTGDATRRYIGAVGTDATGAFVDTRKKRLVWNRDNQVARPIYGVESTGVWYFSASNVWRELNNAASSRVEVLVGANLGAGAYVSVQTLGMALVSSPSTSTAYYSTGVGIDSSTVNVAQILNLGRASSTVYGNNSSSYEGYITVPGRHTVRSLEIGQTGITYYVMGYASSPPFGQNGLNGFVSM